MAIDSSIPLQGFLPKFDSPATGLEQNVRIADMLAQVHQRQAETADYNAQAPLRQADLANKLQAAAEQNAIKQTFAQSLKPYDPSVGDIEYDDTKWEQLLSQHHIPGIGPANYLRPKLQAQVDAQKTAHRQQFLTEADEAAKANLPVATAGENLLTEGHTKDLNRTFTDDDNKALDAGYPTFREIAVRMNPGSGKTLPPTLNDNNRANVIQQIHSAVTQHKLLEDTAAQLKSKQDEEKIDLSTPEGREREIKAQIQQFTAQNGKPPDQETIDAIREGVMQKGGFTGFKINRKAPTRATFGRATDNPPPGAMVFGTDQEIVPKPGELWVPVFHGTDVLGYQRQEAAKPTAASLAEKAAEKGPDGQPTQEAVAAQAALDKLQRPTTASLAFQAANGDAHAAAALKLFPSQTGAGAVALSDDAVTMDAKKYLAGAPLGTFGMGGAKYIVAIKNRAAELGKGADIATQMAIYKSNNTALTQLQKQASSINAFENTSLKNLDQFLKTAKSVVDTGSPLINKPLREIDERALGSTELTAFRTARQVALTEIAKVLSGSMSSVLSDSQRHEVEALIPADATLAQIYKAANILKQDMANRKAGFQEEISDRTKAIQQLSPLAHEAAQPETPAIQPPAGKVIRYDAQGNRIQ